MLRDVFVLKIIKSLYRLFVHVSFVHVHEVDLKLMTSETGKQINAIRILRDVSKIKSNLKFSQVI